MTCAALAEARQIVRDLRRRPPTLNDQKAVQLALQSHGLIIRRPPAHGAEGWADTMDRIGIALEAAQRFHF